MITAFWKHATWIILHLLVAISSHSQRLLDSLAFCKSLWLSSHLKFYVSSFAQLHCSCSMHNWWWEMIGVQPSIFWNPKLVCGWRLCKAGFLGMRWLNPRAWRYQEKTMCLYFAYLLLDETIVWVGLLLPLGHKQLRVDHRSFYHGGSLISRMHGVVRLFAWGHFRAPQIPHFVLIEL